MDLREARLGEKITDWELSGYPVRIECGERDREAGKCVVVSRISGEKTIIEVGAVSATVDAFLDHGQQALRTASRERLESNTVYCDSLESIGAAIEAGKFGIYAWDGNPEFETIIKDRYKATTRCLPFEGQFTDRIIAQMPAGSMPVVVARSF
jgi:prolyl-tRNA synthetase